MMNLIMSILGFMLVAVAVGVVIGIIIAVPTMLYCIPYYCWLGSNAGENGVPVCGDRPSRSSKWRTWQECKNATKLYCSWITKKPHGITRF